MPKVKILDCFMVTAVITSMLVCIGLVKRMYFFCVKSFDVRMDVALHHLILFKCIFKYSIALMSDLKMSEADECISQQCLLCSLRCTQNPLRLPHTLSSCFLHCDQ